MKKCAPRLHPPQIARLEALGFEWTTVKGMQAWEDKFNLLQEYFQQMGDSCVPTEVRAAIVVGGEQQGACPYASHSYPPP